MFSPLHLANMLKTSLFLKVQETEIVTKTFPPPSPCSTILGGCFFQGKICQSLPLKLVNGTVGLINPRSHEVTNGPVGNIWFVRLLLLIRCFCWWEKTCMFISNQSANFDGSKCICIMLRLCILHQLVLLMALQSNRKLGPLEKLMG